MIKRIWIWLGIAVATMLLSVAVAVLFRPALGLDFTGGSLLEASVDQPDLPAIRQKGEEALNASVQAQVTENKTALIRTSPLSNEQHQTLLHSLQDAGLVKEELRYESVGPTIGAELRRKAVWAVALAIAGMIAYLTYEFRQLKGITPPWKLGVAAVLAMVHDILITIAVYGVLGRLFGASADLLFITALLAIMGYSVNDTIIIFNRMRLEWLTTRKAQLLDIMDAAVRKTLVRSLNTSLTALLSLLALLIFGGSTIRWFVATLTIGAVAGTYSSIFVAPPLLYWMAKGKRK